MNNQAKLEEARRALHELTLGKQVTSITRDGKRVDFQQTNIQELRNYISQLEALETGQPRRRGFQVQL